MWRYEDDDGPDWQGFTHWEELERRWRDRFGISPVTASQLLEIAAGIPGANLPRDANGKLSARRWGRQLSDADVLEYDGPFHTERGSCYRLLIVRDEKQPGHCEHKTLKCLACGQTLTLQDGRLT